MPKLTFAILVLSVIGAAAITVWALSFGGPKLTIFALPVFLILAAGLRAWRR